MGEHALTEPRIANTPQSVVKDTRLLPRGDTNRTGSSTAQKCLLNSVTETSSEFGFNYDFSGVPALTGMERQNTPLLRSQKMVQRSPLEESDTGSAPCPNCPEAVTNADSAPPGPAPEEVTPVPGSAPTPETESSAPGERPAAALIVEDSAEDLGPEQMRKSDFLARLRSEVSRAVDAALAGTGRDTEGCPYLENWFNFYDRQDSAHVERAIHRYAPETTRAATALEYIPVIAEQAHRSAEVWARTGENTGIPEGLSLGMPGMGLLGGMGSLISGIGSIFFKARDGGARRADDPRAIQAELGEGRALDSGVRSRMESAFGMDFSHVRTHTDTIAAGLSIRMNARAFTVGEHVAFGSNEYKPGTLTGDALIAHELAHVVQQGGVNESVAPLQGGDAAYNSLENDADNSAKGALASIWGNSRGMMEDIAKNAMPRLRSGLSLQRCASRRNACTAGEKSVAVDLVKLRGSSRSPASDLDKANDIYNQCCVKFVKVKDETVPDALSDSWLGGDMDLNLTGITCSHVPTEEKRMYDGATTKFKLASHIRAFYVETLSGYKAAGYSRPPFCAAGYPNHLVIPNCALDDTLAHEIGHILLNSEAQKGIDDPLTTDNLMVSPGRTSSGLDASQCKIISKNTGK